MPLDNKFDKILRGSVDGKPSRLPGDMLQRILDQNQKKKRLMFWWLNFSIGTYAIVLAIHLFGIKLPETLPSLPQKTTVASKPSAKTNSAPVEKMENNGDTQNNRSYQSTTAGAGKSVTEAASPASSIPTHISETGSVGNNGPQTPAKPEFPPIPIAATTGNPELPIDSSRTVASVPATVDSPTTPLPALTQITKTDSATGTNDITTAKSDASSDKKSFLHGLHWDPFVSAGWMYERQKLGANNTDPNWVHKDLASLLSSAARPASGVQFNLGVRTAFLNNYSFQAGIQYANLTNRVYVDYVIQEIPVVDQDGSIRGYLEIQDTFKTRFVAEREFKTSIFSLPIQFGYNHKIGLKNEIVMAVGIRPQMHMVSQWVVPESINIISLKWADIKQMFSAPATINLGYFRNEKNFTFGFQTKWSPFFTTAKNLNNHINLRTSQNEIGFLFMYRMQPKK